MRQSALGFLHLLVVLWSFGVGGEGCRPDGDSRSRKEEEEEEETAAMSVCSELDGV